MVYVIYLFTGAGGCDNPVHVLSATAYGIGGLAHLARTPPLANNKGCIGIIDDSEQAFA